MGLLRGSKRATLDRRKRIFLEWSRVVRRQKQFPEREKDRFAYHHPKVLGSSVPETQDELAGLREEAQMTNP